jgi:predicted transcriptional regulator
MPSWWIAPGSPEHWEIAFKMGGIWGINKKRYKRWEKLSNGDYVLFYATKPVKGVIGYGTVKEKFKEDKLLWSDEIKEGKVKWPYRFKFDIKYHLPREKWEQFKVSSKYINDIAKTGFNKIKKENEEKAKEIVEKLASLKGINERISLHKHALVLADEDWCKAASSGKIKVYDFIKKRKRGIYALKPGSVCVVIEKAKIGKPIRIFGEFTVAEIKKVNSHEYDELAKKGYIHSPQSLKPKEKRWIILFNNFIEYPNKVSKEELINVKTSTSKKPISEWKILGLTYIDQQALKTIRNISGFPERAKQLPPSGIKEIDRIIKSVKDTLESANLSFPITHECVEMMLLRMGKQLGFQTYTADSSRECNGASLKEFVDMGRDELRKYAGEQFLKDLINTDVIWYTQYQTFYLFEVIIGGDMKDALIRFLNIGGLKAKMFIVASEDRRSEYENLIRRPAFREVKCVFIPIPELIKMYVLTILWRQSTDKFIPLS